MKNWLKDTILHTFSIIRALLRFVLVTMTFFLDGIGLIIFADREIVHYRLVCDISYKDNERLAYVAKLENQMNEDLEMEGSLGSEDDFDDTEE
jgi:hypothetical protein